MRAFVANSKALSFKEQYGEKPYACRLCPHRANLINSLKDHHGKKHKNFNWTKVRPTRDPALNVSNNQDGLSSSPSSASLGPEDEVGHREQKKRKLDDNLDVRVKGWS
jgi:cellulose biosynthesis protein BcsQ